MELLLLGGTAALGRAIATDAVARGHKVTCLARGNGDLANGAELVRADRDEEDGLAAVTNRRWDAVIDLTRHPAHARRAARDLRADHWVFISTISVYSQRDVPARDESASVEEPLSGDYLSDPSEYGSAKVACEHAYLGTDSHTIIRPGLIGGDQDVTGRSGYYPWRFAHPTGNDVLVPDPSFPVALIDIRDLAAWVIDCCEHRTAGTFNAAGDTTTLGEVLRLSRDVAASTATPRTVGYDELAAFGVNPWMGPKSLPLWVGEPGIRHVASIDNSAAKRHGLRLRPLRETLFAALEYENASGTPCASGLTDAEEVALRARLG